MYLQQGNSWPHLTNHDRVLREVDEEGRGVQAKFQPVINIFVLVLQHQVIEKLKVEPEKFGDVFSTPKIFTESSKTARVNNKKKKKTRENRLPINLKSSLEINEEGSENVYFIFFFFLKTITE